MIFLGSVSSDADRNEKKHLAKSFVQVVFEAVKGGVVILLGPTIVVFEQHEGRK